MIHANKRFIALLLAMVLAVLPLAGCKSGASAPKNTPPASDIADSIKASCTFEEMVKLEDSVLYNQYTDLNPDIVEDISVYASTLVLADEICVLRVKTENDVQAALSAIDTRLVDLKDKFTGYREEELPKVTDALIETRGTYILMTTTPDHDKALKEFETALG